MVVGILRIEVHLSEPMSLKDKRRIIRSSLTRVQNKFNASAAEVDFLDDWHRSGFGFSCVSNETGHADSMMDAILRFIESDPQMEVVGVSTEIVHC